MKIRSKRKVARLQAAFGLDARDFSANYDGRNRAGYHCWNVNYTFDGVGECCSTFRSDYRTAL